MRKHGSPCGARAIRVLNLSKGKTPYAILRRQENFYLSVEKQDSQGELSGVVGPTRIEPERATGYNQHWGERRIRNRRNVIVSGGSHVSEQAVRPCGDVPGHSLRLCTEA